MHEVHEVGTRGLHEVLHEVGTRFARGWHKVSPRFCLRFTQNKLKPRLAKPYGTG